MSFGTINANTSGVASVNITQPSDDEGTIQFTRNATWCIPQIINLSSNRDQLTVQAINPSASAHNCSATIIIIHYKIS